MSFTLPPLGRLVGGGQYWGLSRPYLKMTMLGVCTRKINSANEMFSVLSPFQPSLHVLNLLVLGVDDVSQESWHVQGLIVEALSRFCVLQSNSETKAKSPSCAYGI